MLDCPYNGGLESGDGDELMLLRREKVGL